MKQKYLIGAALILFILLAGNYYKNYFRSPGHGNIANAQTPDPGSAGPITPAVENGPSAPAEDNTATTPDDITGMPATTYRHSSHKRPHPSASIDEASQGYADANVWTGNKPAADAVVQSSYDPAANNTPAPARRTIITRRRVVDNRRHFSLVSRSVNFGPEFGFNQNGLYDNNTPNMMTGNVNAGINVNVRMGDHLALQPALLYMTKGNRWMDEMDVSTNEKLKLHYLEVPIDLVYKIGQVTNTRFLVGAGPYVSYLVSAHDKFNSPDAVGDVLNPATPAYNTSNIVKLDWGVNGFIGCETPEGIYAKVGVDYGLRDIQQDPATGISSNRNYNFIFSVGYMLGGYQK